MAKKSKDTTTTSATKTKSAEDPVATRHLVRLLNTLALLLAITAFLLQLFAVLTHHWKYQITNLQPLLAPQDRPVQAYVPDDSRVDQRYGLYSRNVKLYSNNDEQLNVWASTRFPRLDNGEDDLHQCLSQTSTLRGSILSCTIRGENSDLCHCRRYPHWNAIIFFEVAALVLLGLVVLVVALLSTKYSRLLKLVGAALAFLAFLFLLVGLILLLSYLKRETRSIADVYPDTHGRLASQLGPRYGNQVARHTAIKRQATHEKIHAYPLLPGQHYYNETHYQQYSEQSNAWVYLPYASVPTQQYVAAPRQQKGPIQRTTTQAPLRSRYGPAIGYNDVYDNTRAGIGWSTILSILSLIPALLVPLLLAYSWLKGKNLAPEKTTTTTTTTTITTGYVPVPHDVTTETIPLNRPTGIETTRQGPYDNYGGGAGATTATVIAAGRDPALHHHHDEHQTTAHTYRT